MDKRDYRKEIEEFAVEELGVEDVVIADGLEEAFLGIAQGFGGTMVPVYSYDMCIQINMRVGMDYEEALEYYEYNTMGYLHMSPSVFKSGVNPSRKAHLKPRFTNEIDNCPEDAPKPDDWLGL